MAVQETTLLPHRLARSAKDLAWASLSGVACELKDPRMAKQAGSSSQTTAHQHQRGDGSQSDEISRSRPTLYARENSFRNLPHASASRTVEEDFVRFQEKDLHQNEWLPPDLTACDEATSESGRYTEGPLPIQNELIASQHVTSGPTAKDRANNATDSRLSRSDTSIVNDNKPDSKANQARAAAAARRLEQIGAQIQRNLAMQMLQQDASVQASLVPTTVMDLQYESAQQTFNQQPRTPQSSHTESTRDPHQASRHHRQTPSRNRTHASLSEDVKNEQDDSQLLFHCPYYACHQNLQRLLSSSSSSRKLCVHAGCREQLETRNAWIEHIALPHHDLQG
jgi:hypothetical protein